MSDYGLRVTDTAGHTKTLTADDATVIAAGSTTMSNSLEADNTYGEDIALGATYNEADLSVLVVPRRPNYNAIYNRYINGGTLYYNTWYLDDTKTYYTRNPSNGVMSSYSAGDLTASTKSEWNPILSVLPIAFWDKMGATTFSSVRLFAATAYFFRDTHDDTNYATAGSTSGTGGGSGYYHGGSVSNINDDDTGTYDYWDCTAPPSFNSANFWYRDTITLAATKLITKVELVHRRYSKIEGSGDAGGNYYVDIYDGSNWIQIFNGSWSGQTESTTTTHLCGHWKGITGIRVRADGAGNSGYSSWALSAHYTYELRAYGPASSNDTENEIVYSIGSDGIQTVDYMIARKKYT